VPSIIKPTPTAKPTTEEKSHDKDKETTSVLDHLVIIDDQATMCKLLKKTAFHAMVLIKTISVLFALPRK